MGSCTSRHCGRCGRESQCKACLGAWLGRTAFCGQFLCFAFQSFRHRSAVFLDKVLHKKRSLRACLGARLVPLHIKASPFTVCHCQAALFSRNVSVRGPKIWSSTRTQACAVSVSRMGRRPVPMIGSRFSPSRTRKKGHRALPWKECHTACRRTGHTGRTRKWHWGRNCDWRQLNNHEEW